MRSVLSLNRRHLWKGFAGGLIGGLAATVVMTQFQNVWSKTANRLAASNDDSSSEELTENNKEQQEKEDATTMAASKVAGISGYQLSREQKKKASSAVHYGFGTLMGALYGLGIELSGKRIGQIPPVLPGALFGIGLFLAADELVVPALGLSEKPSASTIGTHVYGLASHLVYGITLEGVRTVVRGRL